MNKVVTFIISFALLAIIFGTTNIANAKTLVFCSEGSPEGFDPALYMSGTTFDASSRQIYNKLVEFERGTTTIVPALAESWEVSNDGLEYTFYLRKGVKFQTTSYFTPSRDFNADDVLFTFNRQLLENHPYFAYVANSSWEYFNGMDMPALLKEVVKVDDYTVKFLLNRPEAPMIANLGMDFASIFSKEYADQLAARGTKEQLNQHPIGSGPFRFINYSRDSEIRYAAHDDYWAGRANIDNLIFSITPDSTVRYQKLRAGECHIMPYPNPADIALMQKESGITVLEKEGLNVGNLIYNTLMAPFDNPRVRKALNLAVNKQAIIDVVFQGSGKIAKNPIPPTIWSYNDAVVDDEYNPAMAKRILAEEGVFNLDLKVWAMPVQRPYNPNARRMAELIQSDMKAIGVNVEIVSYEWGEYIARSKAKDRDGAVLLGWTGQNGDPDNFLALLLSCSGIGGPNRAHWCYKPFDDLVQKAKITSDINERTRLYEEAQIIFKEQAPWNTIAHSVVYQPIRNEIKDFKIDPFGGHIFYGVDTK